MVLGEIVQCCPVPLLDLDQDQMALLQLDSGEEPWSGHVSTVGELFPKPETPSIPVLAGLGNRDRVGMLGAGIPDRTQMVRL